MSIHPSLRKSTGKTGAMRNVMKRHERLRHLIAKGLWKDGASAFGLPKIKQERVKAKKAAPKEKAAAAEKPADGAAAPKAGAAKSSTGS